jgi:hypothetical protein
MRKKILVLSTFFAVFAATAQPPKVPAKAGTSFGSKTTADNAITVEQLYAKMNSKTPTLPVKLKGKVTEVCKEMGCWIKIQSEKGDMTVRMKDHSFFVPLELSGKTVVIDGIAEEKLTSVDELRDVAQDGGKSKTEIAKITQPKKEIVVQAKGVLVL